MMKTLRCMGCGKHNPVLELRDPSMEEDGLYVCRECGSNAFEFYKREVV